MNGDIIYKGGWQHGSVVMQKLEGPVGNGKVIYPCGDRFEGMFHLSYAHISGPAYAAEGRYTFADGSWIEHAWIHTAEDRRPEHWGLHGVFRICRPEGSESPDSIAMFRFGKRYGFELFLGVQPCVCEWYDGQKVVCRTARGDALRYEVTDSSWDDNAGEGCLTLRLTLKQGDDVYRIVQRGGRYTLNNFDRSVYETATSVTLWLPGGDSLDYYGVEVRNFKPFDGYVDVHCAQTGLWRTELWERGVLKTAQKWQRDRRAAVRKTLPDPTGAGREMEADVWQDNHIEYCGDEWVYDGEMKDGRPEGQGVLTGSRRHGNRRYEGRFTDGVYVSDEAPFDGEIRLHAKSGHKSWTVYSDGEWKYEEKEIVAKIGSLDFSGFRGYEITDIKADSITVAYYEKTWVLRPDEPLHLYEAYEGREHSDGCVYDGDDYCLHLTWVK